MASGLNGQHFAFNGYLPIEASERKNKIKELEKGSREGGLAQVFIETPYRNEKLLSELSRILSRNTLLCVACDITLPTEFILTQTADKWRETEVSLHKRPSIFIIQG
jgi:16S rRNA (cytidine1402-2'-O)-methyltransferase